MQKKKNRLGYDFKSLYPNKKTLSSSQFLLYEEDPQQFYMEYVLEARREASKAMIIGSIFSALHEDRKYNFREELLKIKAPKRIGDLFDEAIKKFPIVPAEIPLKCKVGKWTLRATLDGFLEDYNTIIENKTGQVEWTQERADFSEQITFQAFVHWKKYGMLPKQIILNWVSTSPRSTQQIITFKTSRTVRAMKVFEQRVDRVIENIEVENFTEKFYY